MKIVEKDFIAEANGYGTFDLSFLKEVNKKDGTSEKEFVKVAYGCSLSSLIKKIVHHRVNSMYESENPYLLEYLESLKKEYDEILNLVKESGKADP